MGKTIKVKTAEGLEIAKRIVVVNDLHNAELARLRKKFEADMNASAARYKETQTRNMQALHTAERSPFPADSTALDARFLKEHGDAYLFDVNEIDEEDDEAAVEQGGDETRH